MQSGMIARSSSFPLFRIARQSVQSTQKLANRHEWLAISRSMSTYISDPRSSKKLDGALAFRAASLPTTSFAFCTVTPFYKPGLITSSLYSRVHFHQVRMYGSRRRGEWEDGYKRYRDYGNGYYRGRGWSSFKKGALFALGVGAVVTCAPIGLGLMLYGAAGYGIYSLYQRFVRPYRYTAYQSDPYETMSENIEHMMRKYERAREQRQRRSDTTTNTDTGRRSTSDLEALRSIDALVEGMPFLVRGMVKTIFSFANHAMQQSMERAGELRRLTNMYLRSNSRIVEQLGEDVSISTPQNWMEQTVNGVSRVEAVFSVDGEDYGALLVTAKAVSGANGGQTLELKELKYHNHRTGEVIDLLADGPPSDATRPKKKTVVEADFVENNDHKE